MDITIDIARVLERFNELATTPSGAKLLPDDTCDSEELIANRLASHLQFLIKERMEYLMELVIGDDSTPKTVDASDANFEVLEEFGQERTEWNLVQARKVEDCCQRHTVDGRLQVTLKSIIKQFRKIK